MNLLLVPALGLVPGVASGVIGTDSSIMLVPALSYVYEPKEAMPIMAVAAVMANTSRILAWTREIDWRAVLAYASTGIPAAVVGARTMLSLSPRLVDTAIGAFLLVMIPARHWLAARLLRLGLLKLVLAGALIGFLTGIVASTGPVSVPVFVGYGLTKGAFIGTEAAGSLAIYLAKTLTFQEPGALPPEHLLRGLIVGSSLMAGAFLAKPFVLRLLLETFRFVMDGLLLTSGISLLWTSLGGQSSP